MSSGTAIRPPCATSPAVIGSRAGRLDGNGRTRGATYHPQMGTTTGDGRANATAQAERAALCDLLLAVGPDAATCCDGWVARDLAAHLWLRENRPDAAAGIAVPALAGWTARIQDGVAHRDWAALVRQVRDGPPRWSPARIDRVDAATNTIEFFVHHEDVRRAAPAWEPRELPDRDVATLWAWLGRSGRLLARHCPVGVDVQPGDGPAAGTSHPLRGPRSGRGTVVLAGPVAECVLAVYGRPTRDLTVHGLAADVDAFHAFPR